MSPPISPHQPKGTSGLDTLPHNGKDTTKIETIAQTALCAASPTNLSPEVLSRIAALQPIQEKLSNQTTDPKEFFEPFQIEGLWKQFTEEDVRGYYAILRNHPLTSGLSWHDFFGLEFDRILRSALKKFPPKAAEEYMDDWHSLYLCGYLGLLRVHPSFPQITASKQFFRLPLDYGQKLNEFHIHFSETLRVNTTFRQMTQKLKQAQRLIQKESDAILLEWNRTRRLFLKFLLHPQSMRLLSDVSADQFPGGNNLDFSTLEQVPLAIQNLCKYVEFIANCQRASLKKQYIQLEIPLFDSLLQQLKNTTPKNAPSECVRMLDAIRNQAFEILQHKELLLKAIQSALSGHLTHEQWCQRNQIPISKLKSGDEFVESLRQQLMSCILNVAWLSDISLVLEYSILSPCIPTYRPSGAYINRIMVNLQAFSSLFTPPEDSDTALREQFQKIQAQLYWRLFMNPQNCAAIKYLIAVNQTGHSHLHYLFKDLEQLQEGLTPFFEASLKSLTEIVTNHADQCKGELLLDKTLWLARFYIFYYDLSVITKKIPPQEEMFPACYLELLALENEEDESPPDTPPRQVSEPLEQQPAEKVKSIIEVSVAAHSLASESTIALDTSLESEQKLPEATEAKLATKQLSFIANPFAREPSKSTAAPPKGPSDEKRPLQQRNASSEDLFSSRKRRNIERILRKLGFKELSNRGHGSHRIYRNEELKIQTVLPNHGEISLGTLKSIHRQIQICEGPKAQ